MRKENRLGAHPYFYFVKHNPDLNEALAELRQQEFQAGRYNPVIPFPVFPISLNSPSPGAQHASIEEAFDDADADGTRSILDLDQISEEPEFGAVTPVPDEILEELYSTAHPTREMIEQNMDLFEAIDRGHGVSIIVYKDDKPDEIFFAGYSYD
jgi:hypothetical protein